MAVWDAYMRGYNLQQENQRRHDAALADAFAYASNHLYDTFCLIRDEFAISKGLSNLVTLVMKGAPTPISVLISLGSIAVGIWDLWNTTSDLAADTQ